MTLVPMFKTCPKCHKKYSWNPDVGKMFCPHCGGTGFPIQGKPIFDVIKDLKPDKTIEK